MIKGHADNQTCTVYVNRVPALSQKENSVIFLIACHDKVKQFHDILLVQYIYSFG